MQNALDGVWNNTIGRIVEWVPNWLAWLLSYPWDVWALVLVAFVAGYVFGKWGFVALASIGGLILAAFTLGRRSAGKDNKEGPAPHKDTDNAPAPRKTLLDLFRRGRK